MEAGGVMTRSVMCVVPSVKAEACYALMIRRRFRHLPVVEDGRLLGIISDRDLLVRAEMAPEGTLRFPSLASWEVMTPHPHTCNLRDTVAHVADLMLGNQVDCVPVLHPDGSLVGIITSTDLVALLRDQLPQPRVSGLPFQFLPLALVTPDDVASALDD